MEEVVCFLVDDDPDDHEIFSIAMKDANSTSICVTAKNGLDALEQLQSNKLFIPDYIFLDLNMPVLDGKQLLIEIKKMDHLKDIPVIIYTTSSREMDIEETRRLGASHFIVKPYGMSRLTEILSSIFERHALPFALNSENS